MADSRERAIRQVAKIPSEIGVKKVFADIRGASTSEEKEEIIGDYLKNTGEFLMETSGENSDVRTNRRLQDYLLSRQARQNTNK